MSDGTKDKTKEPMEPINLRFPTALKRRLQHWCIDNDREMTDVLIGLTSAMLSGKAPVPPPAKKPRKAK